MGDRCKLCDRIELAPEQWTAIDAAMSVGDRKWRRWVRVAELAPKMFPGLCWGGVECGDLAIDWRERALAAEAACVTLRAELEEVTKERDALRAFSASHIKVQGGYRCAGEHVCGS